jgi:hypothetical protein
MGGKGGGSDSGSSSGKGGKGGSSSSGKGGKGGSSSSGKGGGSTSSGKGGKGGDSSSGKGGKGGSSSSGKGGNGGNDDYTSRYADGVFARVHLAMMVIGNVTRVRRSGFSSFVSPDNPVVVLQ